MEKKRRQVRTRAVLPVRLRGKDSSGKVFDDLAHTLDVTATGVRLGSVRHELQKFEQACSLLSDDLDKQRQDRAVAIGGFALAGVGLAATLTAYLLTSNRSSTSGQALIVPVLAQHQRGLALVGRF